MLFVVKLDFLHSKWILPTFLLVCSATTHFALCFTKKPPVLTSSPFLIKTSDKVTNNLTNNSSKQRDESSHICSVNADIVDPLKLPCAAFLTINIFILTVNNTVVTRWYRHDDCVSTIEKQRQTHRFVAHRGCCYVSTFALLWQLSVCFISHFAEDYY